MLSDLLWQLHVLRCQRKRIGIEIDAIEGTLRAMALEAYDASGIKAVSPLVIKKTTDVSYNKTAALEWAETNAPQMIRRSLDTTKFKSFVKSGIELPDELEVVTAQRLQAQIPRDLSKVI